MAVKKITDLPAAVFADLTEADALFEIADTAGTDTSRSVTMGLLRSFLFAGVSSVLALGVDASGADAAATGAAVTAPRSTGNATPGALTFQVGKTGVSGAAAQALIDALAMRYDPFDSGIDGGLGVFFGMPLDLNGRDESTYVFFGQNNAAPTAARETAFGIYAPSSAGQRGRATLLLALENEAQAWRLDFGVTGGMSAVFDDLSFKNTAGVNVAALSQAGAFNAVSYKVGGVAGIDFSGPVAASTLTFVKGILTVAA